MTTVKQYEDRVAANTPKNFPQLVCGWRVGNHLWDCAMNKNYRIEDKRNVTLNGVKATLFTIYHREPHPLLGSAFVYQGAYAGVGHDLTDEECLKAFEETPDDC